MSDERWKQRCSECGDQAVTECGQWCERHRPGPSAKDLIAAIASERIEAYDPRQAEADRKARELEAAKGKLWRERVLAITRSWVARNAFATKDTQAVRGVAKWMADGCTHALVLRGGVGTGKTSAACVAVKHWCEPRVYLDGSGALQVDPVVGVSQVTWLRPDQLVSAIMHDYDPRSPVLHRHVVIDDMGRETRPEFVEALCELFDRDHVVLITSNLPKDQMRKRYGGEPRLIDRMRDRARAVDITHGTLRAKNEDF